MRIKTVRLCSVALSAFLGASAFLEPAYCGWFVFIFLIPVFYLVANKQICYTFCEGLLWGIIFFSLHMYGLLCVILERAQGQGGLFAFSALVLYCSVYAGVWFWLASLCATLFYKGTYRLLPWIAMTFVFFFVVNHSIFFIFGCVEGYPLALPLLPLACYPQWLRLMPTVGTTILFLILLFFTYFFSLFLVEYKLYFLIGAAFCFLPFSIGWLLPKSNVMIPEYVHQIAAISPPHCDKNPLDAAQEITYHLIDCCELNPEATIFIMPESTFPFPLNEYLYVLKMWSQNVLFDEKILVLGAHRCENNKYYNTLYCIKEGRITQLYDKTHVIPFTESLPPFFKNHSFFKNLFLNHKKEFTRSKKQRTILSITKDLKVVPYICSELFFSSQKEADASILCIINDSWFSAVYMRHLLFLAACYKALEWQQPILYVSYYYAHYLEPNGQLHVIPHYYSKN